MAISSSPYDLDPDVAVIKKRMPAILPGKSSMSGKNPNLQPDEEYSYETDPDIVALKKRKEIPPEELDKGGFLPSWLKGGGEALLHTIATAASYPISSAAGIYGTLTSGKYGTPEGIQAGNEMAAKVQQAIQNAGTQPTTEEGKNILESVQSAFEASKLPPVDANLPGLNKERQLASQAGKNAKQQLNAQFANVKTPKIRIETVPNGQSIGAAAATSPEVMQGNINAAIADVSPELQTHVQTASPESVNIPALETRALEEKHGINLTKGQRTGDTGQYVTEWNNRGTSPILQEHFQEQPVQIGNAFEKSKIKNAPDIPSTADASELGQHEINALVAKDKVRTDAISQAYKDLQDANGGQFPIDINTLKDNINTTLSKNLKTNHLSDSMKGDLKDFYENPTFEAYEALRTNLANEMRSSSNGNARAAAYIVRQELEKLPIFGEEGGNPQAIQLKQLADKARQLYAERQNIIKNNPAYKAAIKEAASMDEASSQGESLNAAKFHNKYVSTATPEAIRRMKAEIPEGDIAHQAIIFGELERAKNAVANPNATRVKSDQFANFLQKNASSLKESLSPEAMKDVMEIGLLSSKIAKPEAGTFSHSNTYSAMLTDLAKQGISSGLESKLAAVTGGKSIIPVGVAKQVYQKFNKDSFAKESTHPFAGIVNKE